MNIPVQSAGLPDHQPLPLPLVCPPLLPPPSYGALDPQPEVQAIPSWVASRAKRSEQQWGISRRRKRNPGCIRQCLRAGVLHPAQCHFLCWTLKLFEREMNLLLWNFYSTEAPDPFKHYIAEPDVIHNYYISKTCHKPSEYKLTLISYLMVGAVY